MTDERKELEYHGATIGGKQTQLYQVWSQMKQRCFNENHPKFKNYGKRGIDMDPRWRDSYAIFQSELEDEIGSRPTEKHSLDRVNNNKGYWPGNVKWHLPVKQNRNKRSNHKEFFRGAWRTLAEISEMTGVDHRRLYDRVVNQKMSIDEAVALPLEHGLEYYEYKGKKHKLGGWAKILNIPYYVLYDRIHKMKWTMEAAFETPYIPKSKKGKTS